DGPSTMVEGDPNAALEQTLARLGDAFRLPAFVPERFAFAAAEWLDPTGEARFRYSSGDAMYVIAVTATDRIGTLATGGAEPLAEWTQGGWQYRLTGDITPELAARIAESMK